MSAICSEHHRALQHQGKAEGLGGIITMDDYAAKAMQGDA